MVCRCTAASVRTDHHGNVNKRHAPADDADAPFVGGCGSLDDGLLLPLFTGGGFWLFFTTSGGGCEVSSSAYISSAWTYTRAGAGLRVCVWKRGKRGKPAQARTRERQDGKTEALMRARSHEHEKKNMLAKLWRYALRSPSLVWCTAARSHASPTVDLNEAVAKPWAGSREETATKCMAGGIYPSINAPINSYRCMWFLMHFHRLETLLSPITTPHT